MVVVLRSIKSTKIIPFLSQYAVPIRFVCIESSFVRSLLYYDSSTSTKDNSEQMKRNIVISHCSSS